MRISRQRLCKLIGKECAICHEDDYSVLDAHRIVPGSEGGKYTKGNTVCICCSCHRKVHAGSIQIDGKYLSSSGYVLRYFCDGKEYISPC